MAIVLPEKFKEYLQEAIGPESADIVISAILSGEPVLSVRVNPRKWTRDGIVDSHLEKSLSKNTVPWCKNGLYLTERPLFTLDPTLHAGAYYVQEPSSMILELLKPFLSGSNNKKSDENLSYSSPSATLLDLCAAPGGKSTHLASIMPKGSKLTVNEVIRTRVRPLRENIIKWGYPDVNITSLDASEFSRRGYQFDFILVDAPCSGEGMFRKDPDAINEWSEESVKLSASRQRRILSDIWSSLSPGGFLAYSTCTMNRYENEDNIQWLIDNFAAKPVDLFDKESLTSIGVEMLSTIDKVKMSTVDKESLSAINEVQPSTIHKESSSAINEVQPSSIHKDQDLQWFTKSDALKAGIIFSDNNTLRLHPGLVKGEGLFFALVQKPMSENDLPLSRDKIDKARFQASGSKSFKTINNKSQSIGQKQSIEQNKSSKHIFHSFYEPGLSPEKYQKSFDSNFITKKPKESKEHKEPKEPKEHKEPTVPEIPDHNYALSLEYAGEWPSVELSKQDAIIYLSRGTLKFTDQPLGYLRVTYGGLGLGFVKNLGTRANNLLPMNHRIRMQF